MIVTRVTSRAVSSDDLSEKDYREIYDEIRQRCTLRKFAEFIGSRVSFAWWQQYEAGSKPLSQDRRNELRRAVGLPLLPMTIAQATEAVDPDATVWQIGEGRPDRVVLVGEDAHEPMTLRLNGDLRMVSETPDQKGDVTGVTRPRRAAARSSIVIGRAAWERLNERRLRDGLSWEAFLARLEEV
jgi:hypothetical protein